MDPSQKADDLRQYHRGRLPDGMFAVIQTPVQKLGQIINISRGGLAFRYLGNDPAIVGAATLDIYMQGKGLILEKVPVEVLSDGLMGKGTSFSGLQVREIRLRFQELTESQAAGLMRILRTHTADKTQSNLVAGADWMDSTATLRF